MNSDATTDPEPSLGARLAPFGCVAIALLGIVQIIAGYAGISYHLGAFWAFAALVAFFMFRFSLPMTIGTFFGARDAWEWHWALALLLAAPGLLLMVPGILAVVTSRFSRGR